MTARIINAELDIGIEVRPFLPPQGADAPSAVEAVATEPKRSPVVDLMEKLALREAEIALHADALNEAREQGRADGRAEAEDAFEDDREAALEALRQGLLAAHKALKGRLEAFETLALQVSAAIVEQLTGDPDTFSDMLVSAVKRELAPFAGQATLALSVSRSDFPDTREVAVLAAVLAMPAERIAVNDDLDAGQCRIQLEVGGLEIDLKRHWRELRAVLEQEGEGSEL